jgi:hypothetical protein
MNENYYKVIEALAVNNELMDNDYCKVEINGVAFEAYEQEQNIGVDFIDVGGFSDKCGVKVDGVVKWIDVGTDEEFGDLLVVVHNAYGINTHQHDEDYCEITIDGVTRLLQQDIPLTVGDHTITIVDVSNVQNPNPIGNDYCLVDVNGNELMIPTGGEMKQDNILIKALDAIAVYTQNYDQDTCELEIMDVTCELSAYPHQFINNGELDVEIVVGQHASTAHVLAAIDIAAALGESETGLAVLDNEISEPLNKNIISVGMPCSNTVSALLMDNPAQCSQGFEMGKGHIRLFSNNDKTQLLVAGYTDEDMLGTAYVLADYELYNMEGRWCEVVVASLDDLTVNCV